MVWCEGNSVDYVPGLARNAFLQRRIRLGLFAAALENGCCSRLRRYWAT